MQIQKVQSNQTTFGTKVYISNSTKNLILKSKAKRKFVKHINILENNGVNDVFVLSHSHDNLGSVDWLKGIVFEKRNNCVYRTPWGSEDALFYNYYGARRNTHANLSGMYKKAKHEWTMRKLNTYDLEKVEKDLQKDNRYVLFTESDKR